MSSTPASLRGLDIATGASLLTTTVSVWLAFDRPMCANTIDGACSPNVAYAGLAVLAGLVAVGLIGIRRRASE